MSEELTESQASAIQKLRSAAADILEPTHDDIYLLRWLKARKMDPDKAERKLRTSLLWRKENGMDTASVDYVPSEFMKRYFPVGPCGTDKEGCAIWAFPSGNYDFKGLLHSSTAQALLKRMYVSMDEAISRSEQQPKMLYVIVDVEHFGIRQFLPAVNLTRTMSTIFNDNYPEILKKAFIFNVSSPKIISMAFNLVKHFIDESTQNKIVFHGKDTWKEELFKDVDPSQVPDIWGGTFTFENADDNWWQVLSLPRSIPESFYKTTSSLADEKGTARVTVNKRGQFNVTVVVTEAGTELKWFFTTENFDIGFGISLETETRKEQIMPITRIDSHLHPESGALVCSQVGTYEIHFDNTYSITRSKKLIYKLEKVSPVDIQGVQK